MGKRILKLVLVQLIIILAIFSYFYYNNIYEKSIEIEVDKIINNKEKLIPNKTNTYEELEKALLNGQHKVDLKDGFKYKDSKEIFNILEKISLENPKVMYYNGAEYSSGKLSISYSRDVETIKKHQKEIEQIRDEFIRENITEDMSEYEKILKVHDYIILNSRYDERLIKDGLIPPESNSSYGILALGVGVCDGYSKAMKYLLDGLDIKSTIVVGRAGGENHAWNLVYISGDYYHIDATWNDPITNNGANNLRYNYFNLTDDEISKSHSWEKDKYPSANNNKYNYFNYNSLILLGEKGLEEKLRETLLKRNEKQLVKVLDYKPQEMNIDEIIERIVYKDNNLINLKSYIYSLDENQGIINFEFLYY